MSILRLIPTIGETIEVAASPASVGRDPLCDVVIADAYVSRYHARLRCSGGIWLVEDQRSTNGTHVNGVQVTSAPLARGDNLRFGHRAEFEVGVAQESRLARTPRPEVQLAPPSSKRASRAWPPAAPLRPLRVFLSYASEDQVLVEHLAKLLDQVGVSVWIDCKRLVGGQHWGEAVDDALGAVDIFIACLSPSYVDGQGYFQAELRRARARAEQMPETVNFVVPAVLVACELPRSLQHLHAVHPLTQGGWNRLIDAFAHRARQVGASEPNSDGTTPPSGR